MNTVLRQKPITFGPLDLDIFITTLNEASAVAPTSSAAELKNAASLLGSSLASWKRTITSHGAETPEPSSAITASLSKNGARHSTSGQDLADSIRDIETFLTHIILRHSNFGFAALNHPSPLDRHFPESALLHLRLGRQRLRGALAHIETTLLVSA